MPLMSVSNRAQLAYKLEGTYPTNFGVAQGGNGTLVNMLSESLDYSVKNESSKAIRSDRQVADTTQVGASAQGGFQYELQYKEFDPFIQGVLQGDFTFYGAQGVSAAITTLTFTSSTITAATAPTGGDAFTNLLRGQWFGILPPAGATQAVKDYFGPRVFRVSTSTAPTSTVITLDASTPINTATAGTTMSGGRISSAYAANGNVMKSYTLEVQHNDVTQFRQYTGMIPSKMDLKLSVGAIVTGAFEFLGSSFKLAGSTAMGTAVASQTGAPANATKGVFDIIENGALISATTYIKSADFSIDNSLRAQEAVGFFGNAGVAAGTQKITGKLEIYFVDSVIYNRFLNGTASSLAIPVMDPDGNGYVFHFPRIKYQAAKLQVGGLDQDNMLSLDFMALPDNTANVVSSGKSVLIYRVGA